MFRCFALNGLSQKDVQIKGKGPVGKFFSEESLKEIMKICDMEIGDSKKDVRICVKGKRDPGYGATSRMLAQAGLSLAFDDLDVEGGIWTPASALGNHLVNRLADVDITFEDVSP